MSVEAASPKQPSQLGRLAPNVEQQIERLKQAMAGDRRKDYDGMIVAEDFGDVYSKGWSVTMSKEGEELLRGKLHTIKVSPIGHFNSGKTWVINKLSGKALPDGDRKHTRGLSIAVTPFAAVQQIAFLDTAGLNSPVDHIRSIGTDDTDAKGAAAADAGAAAADATDGAAQAASCEKKDKPSAMERLRQDLREVKRLEEYHRLAAFEFADCFLFVIGQMSHQDQVEILLLLRQIENAGRTNKQVFVLHNLRRWSHEQLTAVRTDGDGLSYIERVKSLFFMQRADVLMEVDVDANDELVIEGKTPHTTTAAGIRTVTRTIPKLFGAFGTKEDQTVQMVHMFLCDETKPSAQASEDNKKAYATAVEHNAAVFSHLRKCIEHVLARECSVLEALEGVMTDVQVHFAEVTKDKAPKLRVMEVDPSADATRRCRVRATDGKGKLTDHTPQPSPLDLPSYLTLGSDDLQYNVLRLQGQAAGSAGGRGGRSAAQSQDKVMYAVQLVLPGLLPNEVEAIRQQMTFQGGALSLDPIDGKRLLAVDLHTVEHVAQPHVVEKLQAAFAQAKDEHVVIESTQEEIIDEGTRAAFDPKTLQRVVPVQLRTGLSTITTLTKPLVAYNDGVLSIVVASTDKFDKPAAAAAPAAPSVVASTDKPVTAAAPAAPTSN